MTTLHVLPNFERPTSLAYRMDPFSVSTYRFIEHMMKRGYNCIHYGRQESDPLCEHVSVYGDNDEMNRAAGEEIAKRKQPGDLIICNYGFGNYGAAMMNPDLKAVEPGIGYAVDAVFAPYRVFTTYAQQHMYYGHHKMTMNPSWFDTVIPNGFDPDEFDYRELKQDYLLYFGRIIPSKGVELCIQLAEKTGQQLVLAGPGNLESLNRTSLPSNVTMVGLCDAEQRRHLMSHAKALLGPTYYVEPFGNMVVEALFSGTPVITTDWGGFTETNVHGVTGYRCRDWQDFTTAINNIDLIKPSACREWAESRYTHDVVHDQLNAYLQKVIRSDFYYEGD